MLQKKLITGLFWVLLLNLLIKPFWLLGIEVGVQNAVGAAEYGLYFAVFNIAYIFNILLDLGVTNFNTRNIARHPQLIGKHLPAILSLKLLLGLLYVVVAFTVGLLMGYSSKEFHLLALLTFNQFLSSLILYLRSNFEGLLLFKWDSVISILDRVVMILICGFLLWGCGMGSDGRFTLFHFVYAQTAAYLLTAALALGVLLRRTGVRGLRFSCPFSMAILKQSLPFALLVLLMASYNRLDPVLLQQLSPAGTGDYQAGIYAGAFRLLDALTMIAYLVSVPLLPIFSRLTKEGGGQLVDTLRLVTSLMAVFAIPAALFLSRLSVDLMGLYDDHIDESAAVFRILIFCIIPISVTYVYGTLLTAGGRLKQLNILAACALVLNVVVNIVCIPRFGAVGSAWAGLTAQSFMALAQVVVALKIFNIRPRIGYILKLALFALCIITGCWLMPGMAWWAQLMAAAVGTVGLALLLRLIDLKELTLIIKENK